MKLPKLIYVLSMLFCITIAVPAFSSNIIRDSADIANKAAKSQIMLTRLMEINEMDKSTLTRVEKKSLRHEAREMKKAIKANNQGVYLSVGAIIIIILLLILIL